MSDKQLQIVPFGKYKGQPVQAMAQDQAYCEWLTGQDGFRTRYPAIHTLIVNNFAAPHETPEHNALQVLFTDPTWVESFVLTLMRQAFKDTPKPPNLSPSISGVIFENCGIDVAFTVSLSGLKRPWRRRMFVECKPSLSDDYPAVLRQILTHKAPDDGDGRFTDVLFVGYGGYTGTGASLEQVRKIFAASEIEIVLLSDVDVVDVEVERG